jgi:hypothetical protein
MAEYSAPFALKPFGDIWVTQQEDLWEIGAALDDSRHFPLLPAGMHPRMLRAADAIEIAAGKLVEYKKLR